MPEDISKQLKAELDQLRGDAGYSTFRPLLEQIERLVNAETANHQVLDTTRATARGLIEIVKAGKGQDPREFLDATIRGQGFHQDQWRVKGDVTQAGRDIINQVNVVLMEAVRELKPPDSVAIPTVLVAMTATEAKALAAESAFKGQLPALLEEFTRLSKYLQTAGFENWTSFYGRNPVDWRPNGGKKSIAELVHEALDILNAAKKMPKPLVPKFYDLQLLVKPDPPSRMQLTALRNKGCVVIVDAISMRHPAVLQAFQRTLLDVYPTTSVLRLAPHNEAFDLVRDMIYGLQVSLKDSEWNQRRLDFAEDYACHELSRLEEFPKWLLNRVQHIFWSAAAGGNMIDQIRNG